MRYQVRQGDSPTTIARAYNVPFDALINANPHKPTTMVAGRRTWNGVGRGETINVPIGVGIGVGAPAPSALNGPHAEIRQGSPSSGDVVLWQTIIGVTPDGQFGPNTATATKAWQAAHGLSADGIVGPNTWAAAMGSAPAAAAAPIALPSLPAVAAASGLALTAGAALVALNGDPNYCSSVAKTGTAVNSAVHNFKTAWNAANPSNPVPVGTGKYEPVVAAALSSALGGLTVPPGCGATAAAPAPAPIPIALPPSLSTILAPTPTAAPVAAISTAIQALLSFNPCDQANSSLVAQAQSALGVPADGKYGDATAAAAQRVLPGAPAGCNPRPAWWTPPGQTNVATAPAMPAPAAPAPVYPAPAPAAPAAPVPSGSAQPAVVAPETTKRLSTGAMVAGAVGLAALVGVVAMAASGGKKTTSHGGARRKSTHKAPEHSAHKSKPKHKKRK